MWSQYDPVTLFGAVISGRGWDRIRPTFERLGSTFSGCESFRYEVLAAGASGDLGYMVGIEHTTASIAGAPPAPYMLRVTTLLRREDREWRSSTGTPTRFLTATPPVTRSPASRQSGMLGSGT